MEVETDQQSTMIEKNILSAINEDQGEKTSNKRTMRETIIISTINETKGEKTKGEPTMRESIFNPTTEVKTDEAKVTLLWMIEDFLSLTIKVDVDDIEKEGKELSESDQIREFISTKDSKNREMTWCVVVKMWKVWNSYVTVLTPCADLFETNVSHVEVTFSLINSLGEKDHSRTDEWNSISGWNNEVEFAYFVFERTLLLKNKELFLPNGTLRVRCDLRVKYSLDTLTKQLELQSPFNTEILFKSQMYTDVTLCCGDTKLRAHKMILSAISPAFEKLFANNAMESQSDIVNIKDIDASIMETLLHYIYGIKTEINTDVCTGLYYAADKLDLKDLKKYCSVTLMEHLNVSNVFDIAVAAHNDDELFSAAKTFARNNSSVFMTKTYKNFVIKSPEIANRFLE